MISNIDTSEFKIFVPVRLSSSRLPGKALIERGGKAHIVRLLESITSWFQIKNVFVATDSELIEYFATKNGFQTIQTGPANNGTERIAKACRLVNFPAEQWIINIQGDLTDLSKEIGYDILEAVNLAKKENRRWITFVHADSWDNSILERNKGSVWAKIQKKTGEIVDFGRGKINENDISDDFEFFSHIGLYAYSVDTLNDYLELPESHRESSLSLEQMRFIDSSIYPSFAFLNATPTEINTEQDFIENDLNEK